MQNVSKSIQLPQDAADRLEILRTKGPGQTLNKFMVLVLLHGLKHFEEALQEPGEEQGHSDIDQKEALQAVQALTKDLKELSRQHAETVENLRAAEQLLDDPTKEQEKIVLENVELKKAKAALEERIRTLEASQDVPAEKRISVEDLTAFGRFLIDEIIEARRQLQDLGAQLPPTVLVQLTHLTPK